MSGLRTIFDAERVTEENWSKVKILMLSKSRTEHFLSKNEKLTIAQFYQLNQAIRIDRRLSKQIFKFHKLNSFLNCSLNKSLINND
jgi:hypothetical protein